MADYVVAIFVLLESLPPRTSPLRRRSPDTTFAGSKHFLLRPHAKLPIRHNPRPSPTSATFATELPEFRIFTVANFQKPNKQNYFQFTGCSLMTELYSLSYFENNTPIQLFTIVFALLHIRLFHHSFLLPYFGLNLFQNRE